MYDIGMAQFRKAWAEAGYPLPWSWEQTRDERERGPAIIRLLKGMGAYGVENAQLFLTAVGIESDTPEGPIDAVGGTIGSLDRIYVFPDNGRVRIEVYNEMNGYSGLRIPGTNESFARWKIPGTNILVEEYLVEVRGWGKNGLRQTFYWWEPLPFDRSSRRPGIR